MSFYEAVAHAFGVMPTGGFSTQPDSAASFSAPSQWVMGIFMLLAGANYLIMYRAFVRRQPGRVARDEELRLYLAIVAVATAVLTAQIWGYGLVAGEEAVRDRVLPDRVDHHHDRDGQHRLRRVARRRAPLDLRTDVRGRLGGLDLGLDQGRPPSAPRQDPSARALSDREPRGGHARYGSTASRSTSERCARSRPSSCSTSAPGRSAARSSPSTPRSSKRAWDRSTR